MVTRGLGIDTCLDLNHPQEQFVHRPPFPGIFLMYTLFQLVLIHREQPQLCPPSTTGNPCVASSVFLWLHRFMERETGSLNVLRTRGALSIRAVVT